jgi:hypothetical protein
LLIVPSSLYCQGDAAEDGSFWQQGEKSYDPIYPEKCQQTPTIIPCATSAVLVLLNLMANILSRVSVKAASND